MLATLLKSLNKHGDKNQTIAVKHKGEITMTAQATK